MANETHERWESKEIVKGIVISLIAAMIFAAGVCIYNAVFHPSFNVGDTVLVGRYEQDNDVENGKERISWIVITEDEGSYLLLSKSILDTCTYNEEDVDITWEHCSLRKWLNHDFYNDAFYPHEKKRIQAVTHTNDNNSEFSTIGGNSTIDNVFLLSIDDVKNYLGAETAIASSD